jgi:hypothetical protein
VSQPALYREGPKDGQILTVDEGEDGILAFADPVAYYRLLAETAVTEQGQLPIAEYVGDHRPHVH